MTTSASEGFKAYVVLCSSGCRNHIKQLIDMPQQKNTSKFSGLPCNRVALQRHAELLQSLMFKLKLVQLYLMISLGVQGFGQISIPRYILFPKNTIHHPNSNHQKRHGHYVSQEWRPEYLGETNSASRNILKQPEKSDDSRSAHFLCSQNRGHFMEGVVMQKYAEVVSVAKQEGAGSCVGRAG